MHDDRARLLAVPRRDLLAARRSRSTWPGFAFSAERTDADRVVDHNRVARFGVLWAAQYDRRTDDLPLLRFLLEQESIRYRETVAWGLGPSLLLPGLLVAEHRQIADVWLHWQVKELSFDTALGYRVYHLLTAGVAATIAAVEASTHPDRGRLLHEFVDADGTPRLTDAAVEDWLTTQQARFPAHPDAEALDTWAHHAARMGDRDVSRRFMLQWADTQPRTRSTLNTVQFHLAELGFLHEAITIQTEAVAASDAGWEKASSLLRLIKLHRQAADFTAARQALHDCGTAMPTDAFWKGAGLWRYFIKEHFLLVPLSPDPATTRQLLTTADRHMRDVPRLWMDGVLDAAITAAEHTGDHQRLNRYHRLQADEHRARDEEIRSAEAGPHQPPQQ